jgi:hypothetical protein
MSEKEKGIKEIYNDGVRLIDLINVILPKIENGKIPAGISDDISEACWNLATNLCMWKDSIEEDEPIDESGNPLIPYGDW